MSDLLSQLEDVAELIRTKHQPGQHDQGKHDPTKGGGGGSAKAKAPKTHGTAANAFAKAMGGSVRKGTPAPGHGKFSSVRAVTGNKVSRASKVLQDMGFEEYEDELAAKSARSFRAGPINAKVYYATGTNRTRVTFSDVGKSTAAATRGAQAAIRRSGYYD